jgi:large subunit ribosomal protein L25
MDKKIILKPRELKGSSNARRMRRDGLVPGVIYSKGGEARHVSIPGHEFEQILRHHAGEQMMLNIQVEGGQDESVLLKDVQHDPVSAAVLHVDLQSVAMNEKLEVEVQIELTGEAEGVHQGGILDHLLHTVEVECLPSDIPESIEVDVTGLAIGDLLCVKDIQVDSSKIEILTDPELGVASVSLPKAVEETDEEAGEAGEGNEPEVIGEKDEEEEETAS